MENTYNGWKNRQTWNVALWIQNDEGLYNAARKYVKNNPNRTKGLYAGFVKSYGLEYDRTPDNIAWNDSRLDHKALNEMMKELV